MSLRIGSARIMIAYRFNTLIKGLGEDEVYFLFMFNRNIFKVPCPIWCNVSAQPHILNHPLTKYTTPYYTMHKKEEVRETQAKYWGTLT